ncbi:CDP-alcohol phosphatidyltransferase family protein [Endothiovibrio diazotrophicus]
MERRDIPNLITVIRILLVAPIAATLAERHYGWALALIAVAGLSDGLDGFLARRFDWRSRLGALLDPLADKLLLTVSFLVLGWLEVVPLWLVAAVIGRDLLIVGGALAYHRRVGRLEMEPSRWSKINTALLLGYLLAVVAGQALGGALARWSPLLVWPVLATTVVSGVDYVIHWSARARKEARR